MPAPIILFVYNRPNHTKAVIDALKKNELASRSELFIFSDGPKNEASSNDVKKVRDYLKTINGFKKIKITEREKNYGLAGSVIAGVTEVLDERGRAVILEDDLVVSPYFLKYMNEALDLYESDEAVASIHGYIYPVDDLPKTFFIRGADCWGWATWKRAWSIFEPDGSRLLKELKKKKLAKEFDFYGTHPYVRMLEDQILGLNDSWAIRWYASAFLSEKFTLYPGRSLVKNIGHDASGSHCSKTDVYDVSLSDRPIRIIKQEIEEDETAKMKIAGYFRRLNPDNSAGVIKSFIKKFLLCLKK